MNSNIPPVIPAARPRSRKGYLVAAVAVIALLLLALSARAVAGYFFLGHSESLNNFERVRAVGPTVYALAEHS